MGHLFQGRYKALLVDEDSYLLQLIKYIHLNPLRAKMVENLLDYPWSSHLAYIGQSKIHWLITHVVFDLLTPNRSHEVVVYQQFILDLQQDAVINFSLSMQKSFPAICDDKLMKKLMQLQKIDDPIIKINFREIVKITCEYYEIKESDLHMRTQKRLYSKIRLMIARLSIRFKVANFTEVANYFNREMSTFSRGVSRMAISTDIEFEAIRRHIESTIVQT